MIPTLVILFWIALFAAGVYRYRKTEPIAEFLAGFAYIWYAVVFAKAPPEDWPQPGDDGPCSVGATAAIISLVVLGLTVAALVVLSIIWSFL